MFSRGVACWVCDFFSHHFVPNPQFGVEIYLFSLFSRDKSWVGAYNRQTISETSLKAPKKRKSDQNTILTLQQDRKRELGAGSVGRRHGTECRGVCGAWEEAFHAAGDVCRGEKERGDGVPGDGVSDGYVCGEGSY